MPIQLFLKNDMKGNVLWHNIIKKSACLQTAFLLSMDYFVCITEEATSLFCDYRYECFFW